MPACRCIAYTDLDGRPALNKRGNEINKMLRSLQMIAEHPGGEHKLFSCTGCEQLWQQSLDWMRSNQRYLFKVPSIEITDWLDKPFVQPDDLFNRARHIQQYLRGAVFEELEPLCRSANCPNHSVKFSVFCAFHHMLNIGIKEEIPDDYGWFDPYHKKDYEFNFEQLQALPTYKRIK
jgi:hypothetical protein